MLWLTIPGVEEWDSVKEEFVTVIKEHTLQLEHSLVALSKWESKWCKPFLAQDTTTFEETIDYVRCMTITQNIDPKVYQYLTDDNIRTVKDYIDAKMTATWFSENATKIKKGKRGNEIVTSELIYFWMIAYNIPSEYQKWHLNRLLTLIQVCEVKNNPDKKKMSMNEIYSQQRSLNEARRKAAKARK